MDQVLMSAFDSSLFYTWVYNMNMTIQNYLISTFASVTFQS